MLRLRVVVSVLLASGALAACGHGEEIGKDRPLPSTTLGAPCGNDGDCAQYCAEGSHFPGGFCTLHPCRGLADCPSGTVCISVNNGVCVYPCVDLLDCTADFLGRGGYTCKLEYGYSSGETTGSQYKVCVGD